MNIIFRNMNSINIIMNIYIKILTFSSSYVYINGRESLYMITI